jgi:aconitate hydratase
MVSEPIGTGRNGEPVFLKDIWPSNEEIRALIDAHVHSEMFRRRYADVYRGDERWRGIEVAGGATYSWPPESTYIQNPPYFTGMTMQPVPLADIERARPLAVFGDSITTDHISPAGAIKPDSPAGRYLLEHGVSRGEFNSYGSRRGNHEVMMRGTFANIRIRNRMLDNVEGGFTRYAPTGETMPIYDAAMLYKQDGRPLVVIAGKEYGTGSSRDWAAKGTVLLGVRAVIAESFERIHRSNLVGMGVLPLQFREGENAETLGLTGAEKYTITGVAGLQPRQDVEVRVKRDRGEEFSFTARCRIDTYNELEYFRSGGILHYVLRRLAAA